MPSIRSLLFSFVLALIFTYSAGCGGDSQRPTSGLSPEELEREVRRADSMSRDVPYVPTTMPVVDRMLELAEVTEDDVVYDLGSGDGRIVIRAAERFGARGVGIEIDKALVQEARKKADSAGVADRATFRQGDLFEADISEATVVTLYLLPTLNLRLRPKLFEELAPGTRVVSHNFNMGAWQHEERAVVDSSTVYLWTIPRETPEHLRTTPSAPVAAPSS
jgi:SAM-dependent methyltransferase